MGLSVVIIVKNEELVIRRCLESVAWADEIVVVDSGSTDRTVDICRELGAHVKVTQDWPGFGPQKNRAIELATQDWILSLDADEWVTRELKAELQATIVQPGSNNGWRMPRQSSFCGRFMQHSGWTPDYVVRLFRRGHARFSDDLVHEHLVVDGPIGTLRQSLRHEAFRDLDELLSKINAYSTAGAVMLANKHRKASLRAAIGHGVWAFIRTYFLRAGFLDGREGFMLAVSTAESSYYRYLKLIYLSRG